MSSPEESNNYGVDPSLIAGNTLSDEEFMRQGVQQLGESLQAVAPHGSEAVSAYLSDLLQDRDGKAPEHERLAAFDLLAAGEKNAIGESVVTYGAQVLGEMGTTDTQAKQTIGEAFRPMGRMVQDIKERYRGVTMRIDNGDMRGADMTQAATVEVVQRFGKNLGSVSQGVTGWRQRQDGQLKNLSTRIHAGRSHEAALDKAGASLLPGYEGEQQDASALISEATKTTIAVKVTDLMNKGAEQGQSSHDVMATLAEHTRNDSSAPKVRALIKFTETYSGILKQSGRIGSALQETSQKSQQFLSASQQPFQHMRPADVPDQYRIQNRRIMDMESGAQNIAGRTNETLRASSETITQAYHAIRPNQSRA